MNFSIGSFVTLNIFSNIGCVLVSVAHALNSSGLFLFSGFIYDRTHSINLQPLFNYMPIFSIYFILLNLSNLSFPGTLNFIGELFSIISLINIDILLIGLFLFNILLVTSYCFFNMSIILVVGYYCGSSCTNRIINPTYIRI